MKASKFIELLRMVVKEEVTKAVRKEIRVLTEGGSYQTKKAAPAAIKRAPVQRTQPLVSFDEGDVIGSILNETAMTMQEQPIDPELNVSSTETNAFVKDYSAILNRSQEIRPQ